ncbi:MAG: RNA recognition motif domain-containing protein [Planctomycetota bacterium]|jgi:RNA recognition motif-containing protein
MEIYVGNLPPNVGKDDLIGIFDKFGEVKEVRLIKDKSRGKFKGFAFIEMPSDDQAQKAIEETNGMDFKERALTVKEANPKKARSRGGRARVKKRGGRGRKRRGVYGGENRDDFGIRRRGGTGKRY